MPEVNRYRIVLYGSTPERPDLKAKIELYAAARGAGAPTTTMGKIKFHEGPLPSDREEKGSIDMHLPASMLGTVIDLLHDDAPIYFAFHEGRAVLGTGVEPIGTRDESVPRLVRLVDAPDAARPVPAPSPPA